MPELRKAAPRAAQLHRTVQALLSGRDWSGAVSCAGGLSGRGQHNAALAADCDILFVSENNPEHPSDFKEFY